MTGLVTEAEEVMYAVGLCVCLSVCLLDELEAQEVGNDVDL